MFFPRSGPLVVHEEQLRVLRHALNTPELEAGDLPAGPARAAIALHDDPEGGIALSVVVQSLSSGAIACWSWEGAVAPNLVERVIEAALSFGESMGFRFDEDALRGADLEARHRALEQWWELVGWPVREAPRGTSGPPRAPGGAGVGAVAAASAGGSPPESLPLTKFRRRLGPAPSPPPAPEAKSPTSALGRMRLVKVAKTGEGAERPPLWLRLLGSF